MQMSDNHGMQMPDLYAVLPPSPCKMAVWGNTGTDFIFSNTSGQASSYNPMTRLAGRTPLPGDRVFCEQVPAPAGMSDRSSGDRVLLRNDGGTPDGDVPALVAKARQWESLCKPDPQLTSAMVVVADILYRIEPRVLHRLNACAEKRGLGRFEFVSSAINRMHNRFTNPAEAVEIMAALKEALAGRWSTRPVRRWWVWMGKSCWVPPAWRRSCRGGCRRWIGCASVSDACTRSTPHSSTPPLCTSSSGKPSPRHSRACAECAWCCLTGASPCPPHDI